MFLYAHLAIEYLLQQPTKERLLAKIKEEETWLALLQHPDARLRFDVLKYLTDKRDGKAVQTINHLHDKPIEVNHTFSIAEELRLARERAGRRLNAVS